MPAQPPLVEIAMKKYGPRDDDRPRVIREVLQRVKPMLTQSPTITSDCALHYPAPIAEVLPKARHVQHLSRRARIGGQGELKKIGLDPLFSLNHTAAMMRDGVSRLIRKTWCNSKRQDHLEHHLYIYAFYRNKYRLKQKLLGA
jgi:hypothetical protein